MYSLRLYFFIISILLILSVGAQTNLALNKQVTVSSFLNSNLAGSKAVDGNLGTRWVSGPGPPHTLEVDLGGVYSISGIIMETYQFTRGFKIEYWNNSGSSWIQIVNETNYTEESFSHSFPSVNTSKVRLTVTDGGDLNDRARIWEFEVYDMLPQPPPPISIDRSSAHRLEAEDYTTSQGVQTQSTQDVGSGLNVTSIHYGDYMTYDVDVQESGLYEIKFRIASQNGNFQFDFKSNDQNLFKVTGPATGGYQNWESISYFASLDTGFQSLKIDVLSSGWNINWIEIEASELATPSYPIKLEAENFDRSNAVEINSCTDVGGGQDVRFNSGSDWIEFDVVVNNSGSYTLDSRLHALGGDAPNVEVIVNGLIAENLSFVGNNWRTIQSIVDLNAGSNTIRYQSISNESYELNWFEYSEYEPPTIPLLIEAEDYISASGVEINSSSDGGEDVRFNSNLDWIEFNINVTVSRKYQFDFRLQALSGSPIFQFLLDDELIKSSSINQQWHTISDKFYLEEGEHKIRITGEQGVWEMNWMDIFEWIPPPPESIPSRLEAENYLYASGIQTQPTSDQGGGENVAWIDIGDYLEFYVKADKTSTYSIDFRVASQLENIMFDLYMNDSLVANISSTPTGGYQTWKTISYAIQIDTIPTLIRLKATGDDWNINWLEFIDEIPEAPAMPTVSSNECGPKTITRINPPAGQTWYWQTTPLGEVMSDSSPTKLVSASSTVYIRAYTDRGYWGDAVEVIVNVKELPSTPTIDDITYSLEGPTLSHAGGAGVDWYWQTSGDGTSIDTNGANYNPSGPGTYYLRALGVNGCWSESDSIILYAGEPINILVSSVSPDEITLDWTEANGNATGYRIFRAESDTGNFELIHESTVPITSYTDTRLTNEKDYYYKIQAVVNDELSSALATISTATTEIAVNNSSFVQTPYYNGTISAVRWKSYHDNDERVYAFGYDQLNRLTRAHYGEMLTPDAVSNRGIHALNDITYDLNGNVQTLERQGLNDSSEFRVIDKLTYDYNDGSGDGNMLYEVYDQANNEGFKDGTNIGPDYGYDANGNLLFDKNKGIDTIYYNHLNLPSTIVLSPFGGGSGEQKDSLTYLYDASGTKLQQKHYKADTLYKTLDYLGATIYETLGTGERTLVQIQHEQGRIVPKTILAPSDSVAFDYQYHLTDHIGNVRVTFSTTPEVYTMVESYENGEVNGFVDLKEHTDQNANTTLPLASSDKVSRLSSGETSSMIFLHLNKGDTMDLFVNANYTQEPTDNNFASTAFSALFGAYNNGIAGGEAGSAIENEFGDALSGAGMIGKDATTDAPRAFVNFIFFDENMNHVTAGFEQISTNAYRTSPNESETISIEDFVADRNGYFLAYLSNENQELVEVFFDDFTVVQSKTSVVYTSDYYPYGMAFNEVSRTGREYNRWKYQGKEYLDEEGLDVYDFHARFYDPALGRFTSVDPKASQFAGMSPYLGMGANPNMYVDPDGQELTLLAAIAISAAISGGTYTASVALSDGGFQNWDWGQFGLSVGLGALGGAAANGIGTAFQTAYGNSLNFGQSVLKVGAHGYAQGAIGVLGGGDFLQSFASGAAGSAFGAAFGDISNNAGTQLGINMLGGGILGGAGAELSGGNFARGFATGAIVTVANDFAHRKFASEGEDCCDREYLSDEEVELMQKYLKNPEDFIAYDENGAYRKTRLIMGVAPDVSPAGKIVKLGKLLSPSNLKAAKSYYKQIIEHSRKLRLYLKNPEAYDNAGHLAKNAGNPKIQQKIIQGRAQHLQHEINTFYKNFLKLFE